MTKTHKSILAWVLAALATIGVVTVSIIWQGGLPALLHRSPIDLGFGLFGAGLLTWTIQVYLAERFGISPKRPQDEPKPVTRQWKGFGRTEPSHHAPRQLRQRKRTRV